MVVQLIHTHARTHARKHAHTHTHTQYINNGLLKKTINIWAEL